MTSGEHESLATGYSAPEVDEGARSEIRRPVASGTSIPGGGETIHHLRFTKDESDLFFRVVKSRVCHYLTARDLSRFGGVRLAAKAVAFGGISLGFYLLAVVGDLPISLTLLSAILFGLSALFFAINVGHEAAHDTISRQKRLNEFLQFLAFAPLGADARLWKLRHVKSHHISPNVSGFDVDVSENGIVRLSPHQKLHWYNRYQHIYAPFVFWLVDLHSVFFYDFKYLIKGEMANIRFIRSNYHEISSFILQKILFLLIMFIIPYFLMNRPWWHIALGALIVTFVNSIVFVYLLIGTHHCEETAYPDVREHADIDHGWAYHQLATSMDWAPLSPIANFFAGGANAHAAHHLFPNISHVHYIHITRIIQEEAKRFGMPYHQSSLINMICSHFRHLRTLGCKQVPSTSVA